MAASTEPKRRIPGESTTNPRSFASPQIQTAPDVRVSQRVAGIPTTERTATPGPMPGPSQATYEPAKPTIPAAPTGSPANPTSTPPASAPPTSIPPGPASAPGAETTNYQQTPTPQPGAGISPPTVPTSTGAPPGVPNTTPTAPPLPPTSKQLEGLTGHTREKAAAENEQNMRLYEAAMNYNGGPASELSQNTEKATGALRDSTASRGGSGTINSSLYEGDKGRISQELQVANLKSYQTYQHSINEANTLFEKAREAWEGMEEHERKEAAEAQAKREADEYQAALRAHPTIVPAGAAIPGVPNPTPHGPAPPGMEWTPSGGGGWVPKGTKVVRTY